MNIKSEIINSCSGNLHHAYLIKGVGNDMLVELEKFFVNELKFEIKNNPDFWYREFDTFGIDDGREIKQLQSRKSFSGDKKIFVITANFFTTQAQNSLLKMFEEPTEGTHFFVITQNTETLLPTLRSRMHVVSPTSPRKALGERQGLSSAKLGSSVDIDKFLKSSKAKRIAMLKSVIENKDKNGAICFLNELEKSLGTQLGSPVSKLEVRRLREIMKCKKYLNGSSPSVKMILEHISLVV